VSANVIAGIVDSGILGDDDLDRLADVLLWHEQVSYRHPFWWLGTTFVEYDLDSPGPGRTIRVDPNTPRPRAVPCGRRCGPGLPAASSHDIERQRATCSITRGRCQRATRPPW
jgi:hypothetical protein